MTTAAEIKARKIARPFIPFRVCMSDGKTYDITNHDRFLVAKSAIRVGVGGGPDDVAERSVFCAITQITRMDDNIQVNGA